MATSLVPTIRELREAAELSPLDIERRTKGAVKRGALSAIERGTVPNPTFRMVSKLAKVLNVDADTCYGAVQSSVEARRTGRLPDGRTSRPATPAPAVIDPVPPPMAIQLAAALTTARELCATLEQLATLPASAAEEGSRHA
jgi:transcriptional regulator with XRE-family HTH domain